MFSPKSKGRMLFFDKTSEEHKASLQAFISSLDTTLNEAMISKENQYNFNFENELPKMNCDDTSSSNNDSSYIWEPIENCSINWRGN
jgi:hypothetical protein